MTTPATEKIGEILRSIGSRSSFSARRSRPPDDLHLEVRGVGKLQLPISRRQAEGLCKVGRPARYGQGEKTLLDPRVRNTWEIPKSRVKLDLRRWKRTLLPVIEQLGSDLGLPPGRALRAELHAMLVYEAGQFFLPHQDSEKGDEMVATLVVTLPSSFKGGSLVVEHQGQRSSSRGSAKNLTFVAFYADCRHQVRPVEEGYRVVLSYNLLLEDADTRSAPVVGDSAANVVHSLAKTLRKHFETPLAPRWAGREDFPPHPPPNRLVYLLDHQYTERGLRWSGLKGTDAPRASTLLAAAERCDCEGALALVEVQETWDCLEAGWGGGPSPWGRGRSRSWHRDDDEWHEDSLETNDPGDYELQGLIESGVHLLHCLDSQGKKAPPLVAFVDDDEVCFSKETSDLEAYAAEYQGYMGNWGNTMDRWYRRAAIVLWPRARAFAVSGEASPAWALQVLERCLRSGKESEARELAATLLPFWDRVAGRENGCGVRGRILGVAAALAEPEVAAALLRPFSVRVMTPALASAVAALIERYGDAWFRELIENWLFSRRLEPIDPIPWLSSIPDLCRSLSSDGAEGRHGGAVLLQGAWVWLSREVEASIRLDSPSRRAAAVVALLEPIVGLLKGAEICQAGALLDEIVTFLCAESRQPLAPFLARILQSESGDRGEVEELSSRTTEILRRHCVRWLRQRLGTPARQAGDWSVELPGSCDCDLCVTLRAFLSDAGKSKLEWPLAKPKRQHVHQQLDRYELPVRHVTRRSGRPYTLVLDKDRSLFEREARERRIWRSELGRLDELAPDSERR